MCQNGAIAALASRERANELYDAVPKINRQRQDGAKLDNDRVHFPEPVVQIDVQQGFADTQMRGRAYGKKFSQSFDDSEKD